MLYQKKSNPVAEKLKQFTSFGRVNVACSPMCASTMKSAGIRNVVTVTNGVDFGALSENRTEHSGKTVLLFGYDYRNKGVDTAIRGVGKLTDPEVRLNICVAGDLDRVKQSIVTDFGNVPEFIRFVPPDDTVSNLYAANDVFLSAGSIESYCYAVREALYCGCRVVVSNIPSQIMHSGEFVFEPDNADSLAKALRFALDCEDNSTENREKVVADTPSLEMWAEGMKQVYESAVG